MIEIDKLIEYWKDQWLRGEPEPPNPLGEIMRDTITYLVAFQQVHEMLTRLGEAIEGVSPGGDGP
ncbi:unnamed protein product [marine sediment metagenome]|uniref:Uncharacterized protein n=1 Tax=marine sediment metagenome TaxID=412755 RepID=X1K6P6_9ZZZZ